MKKFLMLSVAAVALSAPAAFAEEGKEGKPHHHKGDFLEKIDTDKDGAISKAEFITFHEARFDEMDKDGDGKVTKEEGDAHRAGWKAKMKEERAKKKAGKAAEPAVEAPAEAPAE